MGLLDDIIAGSDPASLDGYYGYIDPNIKARTWEPDLNIEGFVLHKDPNTLYTSKNGRNIKNTQAHEFEHTQQLKSNRKFDNGTGLDLADRWDLSKQLYPYLPKVKDDDPIYNNLSSNELARIHLRYKEFLADLAGIYRSNPDPQVRQKIEEILKKSKNYSQIKRDLYPTLPHADSSEQSVPSNNPPMSLIDLARQWIRNKTAY